MIKGAKLMLGWIWPPYGYRLRAQAFYAFEEESFDRWWADVYLPFLTVEWPKRLEKEFNSPHFAKRFLGN